MERWIALRFATGRNRPGSTRKLDMMFDYAQAIVWLSPTTSDNSAVGVAAPAEMQASWQLAVSSVTPVIRLDCLTS